MITGILYFFGFLVAYIIMAQISKYLSVKIFGTDEKYKIHSFVSMNMLYTIMIVILDYFMGADPSMLIILIAVGVITFLYATKLKDEKSK